MMNEVSDGATQLEITFSTGGTAATEANTFICGDTILEVNYNNFTVYQIFYVIIWRWSCLTRVVSGIWIHCWDLLRWRRYIAPVEEINTGQEKWDYKACHWYIHNKTVMFRFENWHNWTENRQNVYILQGVQ